MFFFPLSYGTINIAVNIFVAIQEASFLPSVMQNASAQIINRQEELFTNSCIAKWDAALGLAAVPIVL